ncbi:GFA family protein [Candidatus Bathyarchaeota archaeon]|nr:GFA family protein [Candidatus Bathyarchaeota archaeon]
MSEETVPITLQCLCGAHTFTTTVQRSALPLQVTSCHCDSCRHMTGALYLPDLTWPDPTVDLSALSKYNFSETLVDYSCGTCGAHMFCQRTAPGSTPNVFSGTLSNAPDLVQYHDHIFVGDTLDGGAAAWLRRNHRDGQPLKVWKGWHAGVGRAGEEFPASWPEPSSLPDPLEKVAQGTTPFHCHCRGVNLLVHSAADLTTSDAELPFYIDPDTRKYLVTSCACESCRRSAGVDMVSWTYAQLNHVEFPSTSDGLQSRAFPATFSALKEAVSAPPETRDPRLGTLAMYQSSPDVVRYHCSRCSAMVFYTVSDRPGTVEIAVGLLSHLSGARSEGILRWNYASLSGDSNDTGGWREGFIRQAKRERDEWRSQRGYPEVWERVQVEGKKVRSVLQEEGAE